MNDRTPNHLRRSLPWRLGALAVLALATSGAADAQQTRSFSCAGGLWHAANCWNPAGVPGALDTAVIGLAGLERRIVGIRAPAAVSRTELAGVLQVITELKTGVLEVKDEGYVSLNNVSSPTRLHITQLAEISPNGTIQLFDTTSVLDLGQVGGLNNRGLLFLQAGTVTGNANLGNSGRVRVQKKATIDAAQFSQDGSLTVDAGGTLTVNSTLFNNRGTITLNSSPTDPVALQGNTLRHDAGLLTGGGRVDNELFVGGGAISPGAGRDLYLQGAVQFRQPASIQVDGADGERLFFRGETRFGGSNFHEITGGGHTSFGSELQLGPDVSVGVHLRAIGTVALESSSNLFLRLASDGAADSISASDGLFLEGGTLTLASLDGNELGIGSSFTLFPHLALNGSFGTISFLELPLAAGARLDFSQLYTHGTLNVVAVPEPGTWLMLLGGLAGLGATTRARRRLQAAP